jgi:hypothetical protein
VSGSAYTRRLERLEAEIKKRANPRHPLAWEWVGIDETEDGVLDRMVAEGRIEGSKRHRVLLIRWMREGENPPTPVETRAMRQHWGFGNVGA